MRSYRCPSLFLLSKPPLGVVEASGLGRPVANSEIWMSCKLAWLNLTPRDLENNCWDLLRMPQNGGFVAHMAFLALFGVGACVRMKTGKVSDKQAQKL